MACHQVISPVYLDKSSSHPPPELGEAVQSSREAHCLILQKLLISRQGKHVNSFLQPTKSGAVSNNPAYSPSAVASLCLSLRLRALQISMARNCCGGVKGPGKMQPSRALSSHPENAGTECELMINKPGRFNVAR